MRAALVLVAILLAAGFALASAPPLVTQAACPGARAVTTFVAGQGVLENLAFDGAGHLYVTGDGKLRRYAPDGTSVLVAEGVGGGLAWGHDGILYAGTLNNAAQSATRTGQSSVVRFTSLDPPAFETYAAGFDMANGLAFGPDGSLFVSNDLGEHVVRIPPGGGAWEAWADVYGANGMVPLDGWLYAAVTFDQRSPLVRIALDEPARVETVAHLSFGAASLQPAAHAPSRGPLLVKGLDDMTLGPDGRLLVAANGAGEVLSVDPWTGDACVLASGLQNPSSLRIARGFAPLEGKLVVTSFDGTMRALDLE